MISKPLNTTLSVLLLILSISLATFVLQVRNQLNQHLENNIKPFDMVIGAKGSPLQLVLSSVLHIDTPTGNIPLEEALKMSKNRMVKEMIPVSYGDNYRGYRILGTSKQYLIRYNAELREGKLYEKPLEVVIGDNVAKKINLQIGNTFTSAHGLAENTLETHTKKPFIVTGILKPTGTIIDHLIVTNLESIWEVHEHTEDHNHPEEEHEEQREITSLLVKFRNPIGALQMSRFINEKTAMQAALPKLEVERLMRFLGIGFKVVNNISIAILFVAGLSIFINLIKTVSERKQELALLRTYGVNTFQLIKLVFIEAFFLSFVGFVLGWFLGRISIWVFSVFIEDTYGHLLVFDFPNQEELLLLALVILTTFLASIMASSSLYKLNVSKILTDA